MNSASTFDDLFQLVHSIKKDLHEKIEQLDLDIAPMHVRVLKIIHHKPRTTAMDIAQFMQRDKAQVTRLLNALIEQGFIVKEPNPEDKRSQCLRLTASGEGVMTKMATLDHARLTTMTQGLSEEELAEFGRVVRLMRGNLKI